MNQVGWLLLYNNYIAALQAIAPFRLLTNVKERRHWATPELLNLIRHRDALKANVDAFIENTSYLKFKELKNEVKRVTIKAKRAFIMGKISNATDNPIRYWQELNSIYNPQQTRQQAPITMVDSGKEIEPHNTADFMNLYFASVGVNLANKINTDNKEYLDRISSKLRNSLLISWRPTNKEEISNLIDEIDIHKSSQVKDINTRLLKDCFQSTIDQICVLFNKILISGQFPEQWKIACVVPIHKKGCKKTVSNYRPISLLPLIAKLFEKLIHTRLYYFLNDNDFFTDSQGGFRPNRGTHTTIDSMLDYIYTHFNNSDYISTVFFDLSKAFDSIDHNILLLKLESAGIEGTCLNLLSNYLNNRQQQCKVNGIISKTTPITYGVPQGSILGPLLFIIFINDIADSITNVRLSLYADDTVFYLGGKDPHILNRELTYASNIFDNWCKHNRLTLNQDKCKSMLFSSNRRRNIIQSNTPICIANTKIDHVTEFKYLGVMLDTGLNFESHINMIKKKITSRMFTLKRIRWTLSRKDALTLYKSTIIPFFDQGSPFYTSANKNSLKALQSLQNKALRIIYTKKKWPGTEIAHSECKLLNTDDRRTFFMLKYAHNLSYNPVNIKPPTGRALRSSNNIILKSCVPKNTKYEKSYIYQGIRKWNSLKEDLKQIRTHNSFKTRVKTELLLNNLNFPV